MSQLTGKTALHDGNRRGYADYPAVSAAVAAQAPVPSIKG